MSFYLSIIGDDIFRTVERIESNLTHYTLALGFDHNALPL